MNKHVIQFSLSLAAMLNFNIYIDSGLLDDARRKIIFFFLFCFRWLTIKPRGCMSFPYCGLSQWRFSLIQGVSPPSDAMGLQWWWTHVLWNAKQQYWVLAVQNAGWMSNASRNAKRTSTSALKSVVQKSRRRKNKIEVIVLVDFCWHGNNFSAKSQDQRSRSVIIFISFINMLFNESIL